MSARACAVCGAPSERECKRADDCRYGFAGAGKVSLILPMWMRHAVADKCLELLAQHYSGMNMELVIVDDGNQIPYYPARMPFDVRVVRLPKKTEPLNACVPYNRGVEAATGDIIALSGCDMLHREPILRQMVDEIGEDRKKYVIAAAWHAERKVWHCHSSVKRPDRGDVGSMLPPGADYHFMTAMHRDLWDACGGFDEDYRHGAGYDDPDLVLRLHRAGAKFVRRDDLVVEHVRMGAHSSWTHAMFEHNRKIFMRKWK